MKCVPELSRVSFLGSVKSTMQCSCISIHYHSIVVYIKMWVSKVPSKKRMRLSKVFSGGFDLLLGTQLQYIFGDSQLSVV